MLLAIIEMYYVRPFERRWKVIALAWKSKKFPQVVSISDWEINDQ